jgi:oxygen-independent coproporphyrinogen-3 oxidase
VYGLPGQTRESFTETLKTVIAESPDRVACFSYAHVPWVKPSQEKVDTTNMPDGFEKFDLFRMAIDLFDDAGYDWIGIDHFAKRDDELSVALRERRLHRNFMGYTTRPAPHMLAFGMSGIGEVCDRFVQNDADLDGYYRSVDAGRLPVVRGHKLTTDDRLRRLAILNIMCNLELPYALTLPGFGESADILLKDGLKAIRVFEDEGFVEFREDRLAVTDLGRFFVRNVCMELDAHLDRDSDKPLFSKTI